MMHTRGNWDKSRRTTRRAAASKRRAPPEIVGPSTTETPKPALTEPMRRRRAPRRSCESVVAVFKSSGWIRRLRARPTAAANGKMKQLQLSNGLTDRAVDELRRGRLLGIRKCSRSHGQAHANADGAMWGIWPAVGRDLRFMSSDPSHLNHPGLIMGLAAAP